jgi:hypothetical protein
VAKPKSVKSVKPVPKPFAFTDREAYERMAVIRNQNVTHHADYAATQLLRRNIMQKQKTQTYHNEMDRLRAASVYGNLHAAAEARLRMPQKSMVV